MQVCGQLKCDDPEESRVRSGGNRLWTEREARGCVGIMKNESSMTSKFRIDVTSTYGLVRMSRVSLDTKRDRVVISVEQ